jgi:hypothetical protein
MEAVEQIEKALDRLGYPKLSTATLPLSSTSPPSRTTETSRDVTLAYPAPPGAETAPLPLRLSPQIDSRRLGRIVRPSTPLPPHLDPRLDGRPTATSPVSSRLNNRAAGPSRPLPLPLLDFKVDGRPLATSVTPSRRNGNIARSSPSYLAPPKMPVPPPPSRFDSRVDGYAPVRPPSPHFEPRLDTLLSSASPAPSRRNNEAVRPSRPFPHRLDPNFDARHDGHPTVTPSPPHLDLGIDSRPTATLPTPLRLDSRVMKSSSSPRLPSLSPTNVLRLGSRAVRPLRSPPPHLDPKLDATTPNTHQLVYRPLVTCSESHQPPNMLQTTSHAMTLASSALPPSK